MSNPGPKAGVLPYHTIRRPWNRSCGTWRALLVSTGMILPVFVLIGCGSGAWNLDIVDHTPRSGGDWEVSTPVEQGMDPMLVARLYFDAAKLETLYGLLVIRNGFLVGEAYFNEGSIDQTSGRQSVTKSVTSALVGIALKQGRLSDIDARMIDFFPELPSELTDPRKDQITIRHLLEMRGGYPDEERETTYLDQLFFSGNWRSRYGDFWDIGYGYQWWSARVGDHHFNYACGHGGNYIILLHDLRTIVVTTADPLYGPDLAGAGGWKYDGAINKVVARFIRSLPET